MDIKELNKLAIIVGYKNLNEYLLKFALPLLSATLFSAILIILLFPDLGIGLSIALVILILAIIIGFPYAKAAFIKQEINQNLHFFITYAGTISTMKISRHILFKRIAQKKVFGVISDIFEKTLYLSKEWSIGYANSCRLMSKRISSKILADFLDRLAVVMDFGEELDIFLEGEQTAVLEDYSVEYHKSLEVIKTIQELFMALSASFAFLISTVLLAPLLIEFDVNLIMIYLLLGLILMDAGLIVAVRSFVPKDDLFHKLPLKNLAQRNIQRWFRICLGSSILLFIILFSLTNLPFVFILAVSLTPLLYPGLLSLKEESVIKQRDRQFPVFSRIFGSAIEVRNGGVISALKATQMHDFGTLDALNVNLYRRLRLGSDKYKSWYYYAAESGSNIIYNFSKIFSESVYLGGNAEKIGDIINANVQHLLSLRKLRKQVVDGITGVFYGITIGISITVFVTLGIAQKMLELFSIPELEDDVLMGFTETMFPGIQNIDFSYTIIFVTLMLFVHAFTSSWIISIVSSGSNYSLFLNFILMIWIIAILYLLIPPIIDSVLPDMSAMWTPPE